MRIKSLDIYRGLTITLMIVVNSYGNKSHTYSIISHAEWNGWTIADLISPCLLFIMGIGMSYSFKDGKKEGNKKKLYKKIIRRSYILFLIGIITYNFPFYNLSSIRIMGVLQRISIVYLLTSITILNLRKKHIYLTILSILLGYYFIVLIMLVASNGVDIFSPENSMITVLDRAILGQSHLWNGNLYDPEGLAASIPATVLTFTGYLAGKWTQENRKSTQTAIIIMIVGVNLIGIAGIWSLSLPINKTLWTSSYSLLTIGFGLIFWGVLYLLIEVEQLQILEGFKRIGLNAIIIFPGSEILERLTLIIPIQAGETQTSLKQWIYENIFNSWLGNSNASLLYGITHIIIWWGVCYLLYKKKIFLKV